MIKSESFLLLAANSTHFIIKLEKTLQNSKICCRIIPLPGEISAGCGLSIKCNLTDKDIIDDLLNQNNIEVEKYLVQKTGFKKNIEKFK